jgi:VWFA-related protein
VAGISNIQRRLALSCLLAGAVVALSTHPARGQENEATERFEEEMVVSEVLLDAVVTDKKGRVILGLGKDDFKVSERGEEVEILGVSFYSNQERVPSAPTELPGFDLSDVPEDRHFIIFVQELTGGNRSLGNLWSQQQRAAQALQKWVTEDLDPADVVAVVSYDHKLKVHQDFTRDRVALLEAIENAGVGREPERRWPSRMPPESEIGPLLSNLPSGKELSKKTKNVYKGLELLAGAAATVPGRKNMIFVGPGFDPIRSPDYVRVNSAREALSDANIAAYTIDVVPTEIEHTSRDSLQDLAQATGGESFFTFVHFESPLERIARGTTGYYLIAYRSEHPAGDEGYQRVKVKVANPEFRVRARTGYSFGSPDGET